MPRVDGKVIRIESKIAYCFTRINFAELRQSAIYSIPNKLYNNSYYGGIGGLSIHPFFNIRGKSV